MAAFRPSFHVEQPEDFLFVQPERRRRTVLAEHFLKQLPLLFQHLGDAFLDRVLANEALDEYGLFLADAMSAIDRLVLDGGVPPAVEQEDVINELEVEPNAAGAVAHQ